jgi:hypothetical protein
MARVIPVTDPEWVLGLSRNPVLDIQTITRIVGGKIETVELDRNTALIVNADLVDNGTEDVTTLINKKASDLIFRLYDTVMPVVGTAILVDMDDFGLPSTL